MLFRLMRICTYEIDFLKNYEILKHEFLKPRNYKTKLIEEQFEKIKMIEGDTYDEKRKLVLKRRIREDKSTSQVAFPINFDPHLPNVNSILKKHHKAMILRNDDLAKDFEKAPMVAYRQPANLRKLICRAKLFNCTKRSNSRQARKDNIGWRKCGNSCHICPFTLPKTNHLTGIASNYTHNIKQKLDCNTQNCIYYWKCDKSNCKMHPEIEYIGKTINKFKDRLGAHRDYVKSEDISKPSGEHFSQKGHSIADLKAMVIEEVTSKDPFVLKVREKMYIKRFKTYEKGLNKEP